MVLINRIFVEEYGKLRNFDVEFRASNIYNKQLNLSIIVGENGTGKTSLLKFISEVFTNNKIKGNFSLDYSINNLDYSIDNEKNEIYSFEDYIYNLRPKKIIVSSYSTFEQFKTSFKKKGRETLNGSQDEIENTTEYVYAGPKKRFNSASLSSIYVPILKNYLLFDFKKSFAIQELLKEIGYVERPFIQLKRIGILKRFNRNMPQLIDIDSPYANDELIEIASKLECFNDEFSDYVQTNYGYQRKKLMDLRMLQEYSGGITQWLEDVQQMEKIGIDIIEDVWFPKGPDIIPMKRFSSGELSMFFRFFKLIDNMVDSSIVLIDEPETHLHPRWIQKYINILNDIFGHYSCHFIIATHSPLIVSDVPSQCIIGLKQKNNNIEQFKIDEQTLGISYREVLREVFHVDDLYSDYTKKLYEDILNLLEAGKVATAKELYSKLGDSELKFDLFIKFKEYEDRG
ncbi:AAA family ATPase [Bacillus thuringiensis]|nr:AAA family ATPase [Bacillus thuringiensis]